MDGRLLVARHDKPVVLPNDNSAELPVGARMRLLRQQKGLSLTEMAAAVGITKGYLSALENGVRQPSDQVIEEYERVLGLDPGTLLASLTASDIAQHGSIQQAEEPSSGGRDALDSARGTNRWPITTPTWGGS